MTADTENRSWIDENDICHAGPCRLSKDGIDLIDCEQCGFRHIIPLPSAETLRRFYEAEFYQSNRPHYIEASKEDVEWRQSEFTDRCTIAEKLTGREPGRALDIGCGPGDFLLAAKHRGWDVLGVEPSPMAAEYAASRGLEIENAFFSAELAGTLGNFDLVHMSEVLEHIPNPLELLASVKEILNPGGILCVSVPNDFNPLQVAFQEIAGKDPWWVVPDHHLNYFDFDSLEKVMENAGLPPVFRTTNFPMEMFLLMGDDYIGKREVGRPLHNKRKAFDLNLTGDYLEVRSRFYNSLANSGLGRLAIVFAQKP